MNDATTRGRRFDVIELRRSPHREPVRLAYDDAARCYSGRPGCMCGCRGKYYDPRQPSADASAANARRQCRRIFNIVAAAIARCDANAGVDESGDVPIAYLNAPTRTYAVYFVDPRDASEGRSGATGAR